jgi:hypothetical protein
MKSFLLFIAVLCALILSSASAPSVSNAAASATRDRATMKFTAPVQLMGVTLQGEYLFVHDDAAMVRGEACTYVYKGDAAVANKLVISFHCTPATRAKVAHFTVRTFLTSTGRSELREFQFAGSSEAHLVPATQHAVDATVALAN